MSIINNDQLTPREITEHDWRLDEFAKQTAHARSMKLLELEVLREQNSAEIQLKTLELKWATWLRIPILILKLPLYLILGIAYIVSMVTKKEMPKRFWDLLS